MSKKNGRTRKTLYDPMHLQQAVMEAMLQTCQHGAMGFGEEEDTTYLMGGIL